MFTAMILLCNGIGLNDCYRVSSPIFYATEAECRAGIAEYVSDPGFESTHMRQIEGKFFTVRKWRCINWTDLDV